MTDEWIEVSAEEFRRFLADYPHPLERDVARFADPPVATYNDFHDGRVWPESVVASATLTNFDPTLGDFTPGNTFRVRVSGKEQP